MNGINKIEIPQTVRVRKYTVDTEKLKKVLRENKIYSNKEISQILEQPLTTVEHWFRTDNCFSIPEPEIWKRLKILLKIDTTEFDESIMTFEEKDGVYEKANRFYLDNGISPTISTSDEIKVIGNYMPSGHDVGVVVKDKTICLNSKGGRNGVEGLQPSRKDRIYDSEGIATTIATNDFYNPNYTDGLRIRKLTPKECWRLMGFNDTDFERAASINSNTQLYKQAGNSIVVNVLMKILRNLLRNE